MEELILEETFEDTGEINTGEIEQNYEQENDIQVQTDVLQDSADILPSEEVYEEITEEASAAEIIPEEIAEEEYTESAIDIVGADAEDPPEITVTPPPIGEEEEVGQIDVDALYRALTEFIEDWNGEESARANINNKINLLEEKQFDAESLSAIEESLSNIEDKENLILTAIVSVSENQKEIFNALKVQNSLMYVQVFSLLLVIGAMFAILVWLRLR